MVSLMSLKKIDKCKAITFNLIRMIKVNWNLNLIKKIKFLKISRIDNFCLKNQSHKEILI